MNASSKWAIALTVVMTLALFGCSAGTQPPVGAQPLEYEQRELNDLQVEISAALPEAENLEVRIEYKPHDEIDDDLLLGEDPEDEPGEEEVPAVPAPEPPQPAEQSAAPERTPQTTELPVAAPQVETEVALQAAAPSAADQVEEVEVWNEIILVDTAAFAAEVIRLVNIHRSVAGVGALEMNPLLRDAAQIRAQELPALFSHSRPGGREWHTVFGEVGLRPSGSGENIASGHTTPSAVVIGWMNSPAHRNNVLAGNFTQIGVGVYQDANGMLHWVQLFAASLG